MEFSTAILTDFALNLAGYLVVALLVYILLSRRDKGGKNAAEPKPAAAKPAAVFTKVDRPVRSVNEPEFISLFGVGSSRAAEESRKPEPDIEAVSHTTINRRENRRAIYREAKRLLAQGGSRAELLATLPLTEDELEMLSVTVKA